MKKDTSTQWTLITKVNIGSNFQTVNCYVLQDKGLC